MDKDIIWNLRFTPRYTQNFKYSTVCDYQLTTNPYLVSFQEVNRLWKLPIFTKC